MKKSLLITAMASLSLITPLAFSDDAKPAPFPANQYQKDPLPSNVPGNPTMPTSDKDRQMHMTRMQDNMVRMHDQMHKIMDAKNPQDRERLMQEHSRMMNDNMPMMSGTGANMKTNTNMKNKY